MPRHTHAYLSCAATVLITLSAGAALAQPADKRTIFTFSAPVAVPGATLPAGSYLFRLADSSSRNVVQVLTGDGKKPIAQFFAADPERPDPAKEPEVRFMETAAGMPAAIRTWWYPGERRGYEFIYPKEQARRLAKGTEQPVLTTEAETKTAKQTGTGDLTRISGSGAQTAAKSDAPASPPTGASQTGTVAPPAIIIAVFTED